MQWGLSKLYNIIVSLYFYVIITNLITTTIYYLKIQKHLLLLKIKESKLV